VNSKGVAVGEQVLAGAVLPVDAVLPDVRVGVAVDDGHGHVVGGRWGAGEIQSAVPDPRDRSGNTKGEVSLYC
jgi:hypothetical protein